MGSITEAKKPDPKTGKEITTYRAFIRRTGFASKSKTFATKAQAREWLRNEEGDAALVKAGKGYGTTFADVVESFVKAPPTRGTKFWHPSQLEFWKDEFGKMKVGEITRGEINAAVAKLQIKPAMRRSIDGAMKSQDRTITPSTVNRYIATLSSVLNFCINREIIDVHPLKAGKVRKLAENPGRRRILTAAEEQKLYEAAEQSTWPMMRLYLRMLLTTGARKSEVLNLRWRDVHVDDSVAILPTTKNGDARALPLVSDVKADLVIAQEAGKGKSEFVFYDPRHPEKPKNVDTIWRLVRERAGLLKEREDRLDRVVLLTTRHTTATKLLRNGANVVQTANITGHKTLAMLKRYTHLAAQDAVDLAEKLLGEGGK